ncbi:hypothetical protein NDU88_000758 [Pleurodeles waltl]|uniref:Uncharacterized protein n=1 Tax=Pleurodeles waltl TaxID=8319 RepID=A0AAV7Q3R4_PLEWA|nr:hypothetical protein NDU88_000758 [Pleurodeles waltl]
MSRPGSSYLAARGYARLGRVKESEEGLISTLTLQKEEKELVKKCVTEEGQAKLKTGGALLLLQDPSQPIDEPSTFQEQTTEPDVLRDTPLQQTGKPEDSVVALSDHDDQPSRETGQDVCREELMIEVTGEPSAEESKEGEILSQAAGSPQEEVCKTPELPPNSFITSNGNTYSLLLPKEIRQREGKVGGFINAEQRESKKAFLTEVQTEDNPPIYLEHILVPENIFKALKERICLGFFEHLEKWFDQALANVESVVSAKMEELKSELGLRLHLHEPRSQRIEKDIHNVRAAELLLHSDRVKRHCAGVLEALAKMKTLSIQLRDEIKKKTKEFSRRVSGMEPLFMNANKSEK